MKKTTSLALTIIVPTYISPVLATENNSWYVGGIYAAQKISLPTAGRDFNTAGIVAGYQYNNFFSLETRFSKGTSGNTFNLGSIDFPDDSLDTDINYQGSIIIKASYPLADEFDFYLTAGYSKTKIDKDVLNGSATTDGLTIRLNYNNHTFTESGLSYGLGLNYKVSNKINLFLDYQVLPDWDKTPPNSEGWDSINIGFNYVF